MMSNATRKYVKEVINHPYVGIQTPFMAGDFAGHARNVVKSLLNEDIIDSAKAEYLNNLIQAAERIQDTPSISAVINHFQDLLKEDEEEGWW